MYDRDGVIMSWWYCWCDDAWYRGCRDVCVVVISIIAMWCADDWTTDGGEGGGGQLGASWPMLVRTPCNAQELRYVGIIFWFSYYYIITWYHMILNDMKCLKLKITVYFQLFAHHWPHWPAMALRQGFLGRWWKCRAVAQGAQCRSSEDPRHWASLDADLSMLTKNPWKSYL